MASCSQAGHVTAIPLGRRLPGASSNLPGRPDPDIDPAHCCSQSSRRPYSVLLPVGFAVPPRCRRRGALLPHRFTLTAAIRNAPRRSVLCGTFPRLAPAGRYPAPYVHGARTFLPGRLSALPRAAVRPTDGIGMGARGRAVKARGESEVARAARLDASARAALRDAAPCSVGAGRGVGDAVDRAPAGNGAGRR